VAEIFERPRMPYTAGLIASIPHLGSTRAGQPLRTIPGHVPSLSHACRQGCRFSNRCAHAEPALPGDAPTLETAAQGHLVRCLRWRELDLAGGDTMTTDELLQVEGLVKFFPIRGGVLNRVQNQVKAVSGVSFSVRRGEVVGLVGRAGPARRPWDG
jgi:oligopeptide/dipeptide ABC transporter ATP-binding protein